MHGRDIWAFIFIIIIITITSSYSWKKEQQEAYMCGEYSRNDNDTNE